MNGPSSPDPNKPCVFPFKHLGKTYYECIENEQKTFLWCKTNSEGTKWGKCGDNCRNHSSGIFLTNEFNFRRISRSYVETTNLRIFS